MPRIEVTFRLNPDRILEARAEDLATGVEKVITIASTGSRLNEQEKNRMVKESRERVTVALRAKIKSSLQSEASDLIRRAEDFTQSQPNHPRSGEIKSLAQSLEQRIKQGDGNDHDLENLTMSLMRMVSEVESAS